MSRVTNLYPKFLRLAHGRGYTDIVKSQFTKVSATRLWDISKRGYPERSLVRLFQELSDLRPAQEPPDRQSSAEESRREPQQRSNVSGFFRCSCKVWVTRYEIQGDGCVCCQ